ncbi:DUF4190 domain-containing protein [Arthrobacter oryzae]|jgi:hypothetical protein|uniref:DUF4190 domain-containing protein n=1 Tax=Arthrobacter oryzae TaxID=409290 RepID=UPI00278A9455|nr:DUF4190 domain-containing protein [Arthrobacter oryzae]MDQ0076660.1 hypothetical protein [Arthrobacter oryzae]
MTNQPAPGDEGTPQGYQPPSYIPPQGPQPMPPNNPYGQPAGPYGQQSAPYGMAYGQPSYYGVPPEPKSLSIASLCCGIAVFLGLGIFILPQIAAVVLGHMGYLREPAGRGLAIAGLVLGYLGLALTAIVLTFIVVAIFAAANAGYGF